MIITQKLAELIGIYIGDGNIYRNSKRGIYQFKIGLNSLKEKDYALNFLLPMLENLFKTDFGLYTTKNNEIFVYVNKKKVVDIIESLSGGEKRIPKWAFNRPKLLKSLIRGLIDTDGVIFPKTTNRNIPQIEFTQKNLKLVKDLNSGLKILGIDSVIRKHSKNRNIYELGIYGKENVRRYFDLVGFNNPKNSRRYIEIESSGRLVA